MTKHSNLYLHMGKKCHQFLRLKSFLNFLLYNQYKESIVDIEYAPNELASLGDKGRNNLSVFDIIVKALFESKKYIFIDIEIQTTFHNQLFMRWMNYANALYSNLKHEILVLDSKLIIKKKVHFGHWLLI